MTPADIIATPATMEEVLARLVEFEDEHHQTGSFLVMALDHAGLLSTGEWHAAFRETAELVASRELALMWPCAAVFADRHYPLLRLWPDDRLRLFWHALRWLAECDVVVPEGTIRAIIATTLDVDDRQPIDTRGAALKAIVAEARGRLH